MPDTQETLKGEAKRQLERVAIPGSGVVTRSSKQMIDGEETESETDAE